MGGGDTTKKVARGISRPNNELRVEPGLVGEKQGEAWLVPTIRERTSLIRRGTTKGQLYSSEPDRVGTGGSIFDGYAVMNHEILTYTGGRGLQV